MRHNPGARQEMVREIRVAISQRLYLDVVGGFLIGAICDEADSTMRAWQLSVGYGSEIRYKCDGTDCVIARIYSQREGR
jgi:hypothetical protein